MESFKISACAALVMVLIPSGLAQPVKHSQISHSSPTRHYESTKALNTNGLPRSTVAGGHSAAAARRSASGHSELDRLENHATNQHAAESRHGSGLPDGRPAPFIHTRPATDRTLASRTTVRTVKRPNHHQPAVDVDTATIESVPPGHRLHTKVTRKMRRF